MGKLRLVELREIEKIPGKALKRIFQLPVSTTYTDVIMEIGIWPAEQKIQYAAMMLYHNIKIVMIIENSSKKNKNKINLRMHFIRKCKKIAKDLQIDIRDITSTSKSKWKKKVKGKAIDRIRKRMRKDAGKNKMAHTTE